MALLPAPGGAGRAALIEALARLQRQYAGEPAAAPGRGTGPAVPIDPRLILPKAAAALPGYAGAFTPTPAQLAAAAPAAAAPQYHGHLDPNYVGYGTPGLEWWGPNPDPQYNDWKMDVVANRQHWRRDYVRPGYISGES